MPAQGRVYYNDTAERHLQVKVYASGRKQFCLYRKVHGRPERIDVGSISEVSLDDARKKVEALNGRIASGENPAREWAHIRSEMTLQSQVMNPAIADTGTFEDALPRGLLSVSGWEGCSG